MASQKILDLSLKQHWFNEIKSGRKTKEYRDGNNEYYTRKLVVYGDYTGKSLKEIRDGIKEGRLKIKPFPYTHIRFHCGNQVMTVEYKGLTFEGNNWVISLGKVTNTESI